MVVVIISCIASLVSMVTVLLLCACCYRRGNDSDTESLDDADYYTRLPQDVRIFIVVSHIFGETRWWGLLVLGKILWLSYFGG